MISAKIEENDRMGKIRDFFKKIRDTKGTFHAAMGTIKDRNTAVSVSGSQWHQLKDMRERLGYFFLPLSWLFVAFL